ncbi:MAG TPA: sensor histidine kinase [Peptococcaceae bacterium]|nr:sensor histidine kinase [Peptococcaceae bacterium]
MANNGSDYHIINSKYNNIALRYLLGFPSCIISAVALLLNAWLIERTKSIKISKRYQKLALIFVIYGFLEGLLVSKADYFPANIINKELFIHYFVFTPLLVKAFVGFIIYYLLMKVIDTFSWEQEEKLSRLEKHRIATMERRKLGREIHDSIIQELFATGLKIEYLMHTQEGQAKEVLGQIKEDLNNTITKIRNFISSSSLDKIEFEDLNNNLEQMVQRFNENQSIKIELESTISPYQIGYLTPEKSTQIYYVIQEALTNIIKHSDAEFAHVLLEARYDYLEIIITDNGKGISPDKLNPKKQLGLSSMKERAENAGGALTIEKLARGTRIKVKIPWEELKNEEKNQGIDS